MNLEALLQDAYYLVFPDGSPAGLDSNSGGYPFIATSPNLVHFWSGREYDRLLSYANQFQDKTYGGPLRIRRVQAVETSYVMDTELGL